MPHEELIPELRQRILEKIEEEPELYDEIDIEKVKNDDWTVKRYLIYNYGDIEASLEHMQRGLQWKKANDINYKSEKDCPREFISAGAVFYCLGYEDFKGRTIIVMRVKVNRKIPELKEFFHKFVIGVINRVDDEVGEKGYGFLFDISGIGFRNVDYEFVQFLISSLRTAYPCGLKTIIAYNVPRIVRPLWAVIKTMLGGQSKMIKFANGDELKKYIPAKNIPKYMGGECGEDFTKAPEECCSVADLAPKYGFTDEQVKMYMEMFEPHIKEAYQLVHCK